VPLSSLDVVLLAPHVLLFLKHFANVLNEKLPSRNVLISVQPKPLWTSTPLHAVRSVHQEADTSGKQQSLVEQLLSDATAPGL
jgi:hypothetical protein